MERGFTREQAQVLYARAVQYTVETLGEHVSRYHERMDEYWFNVPPGRSENDIGEQLIATGYYRYACPNWRMGRDVSLDCTNDEFLGDQWNLKRLEACAGWQIHSSGHDDVVLAVIDAGLRTSHEDFSALNQYRREGYNVTEGLWESENGTIWSQWYHGTIVTGAAAATGNNGVGTSGIGWSLRHRMLVAEDADDTFKAMEIAGMAGDRIIVSTASITPDSQTQGLWNDNTKWITEEFNVLIVQSGGNYPENDFLFNEFPYMIVVGGTDPSDNRWINGQGPSGSTVGPHLDVMAPAVDIFGPDRRDMTRAQRMMVGRHGIKGANKMFMTCAMGLVLAGVSNGAATFAGPDALAISIDGSCPGVVRFRRDGASPDQWAGLIYSDERGNFTLNQPCGGTVTGLGTRGLRLVWLFRTGAAGQGAATGRAASPSCGGFLRMVVQDGNPCTTSNVVQIPQ